MFSALTIKRLGGRMRARATLAPTLAVLVTIGLAAASTLTASVISHAVSTQASEESVAELPLPELIVAPTEPTLTTTMANAQFEVVIRNPTEEPLPAADIVLSIDNLPADSMSDIALDTDRDSLEFARVEAEETAAGEEQVLEITVPRDELPLTFSRAPGVYAVHAELTSLPDDPTKELLDNTETDTNADASSDEPDTSSDEPDTSSDLVRAVTSLIWESSAAATPVNLTLVVPLVLPQSIRTLPTAAEMNTLAPQLLELVDAALQRDAVLAVDPRIIVATRALGTAAPDSATSLLERLETTAQRVFLLQFADADPAAQAALGFDTLLQPIGFDYALSQGEFEPAQQDTETDTPNNGTDQSSSTDAAAEDDGAQPNSDEAADTENGTDESALGVPSFEELLTLTTATPGAWPAEGQVSTATLQLIEKSALDFVVLDSTNVESATGSRVDLAGTQALLSDSNLARVARSTFSAETTVEQAAGATELATRLALAAENESEGVVLALDRGALAEAANPQLIFSMLDAMPWVTTVSEEQQPLGTATFKSATPSEQRTEALRDTLLRSEQIDELAPLLTEPQFLLEYQRERLLQAFATRYAQPDIDLDDAYAQIRQRDEALLKGVAPVTTEHTQLVGTSSRVPITLSNALPFDAEVLLYSEPFSAAISLSERRYETVVPAEGNSVVLVPVHSRVSSGETALLLEVRDAGGETIYTSGIQHLVLRTAIESILLGVLGSAAALLLGFGVWRSVKQRRQDSAVSQVSNQEVDE